MCAIWFRLHVWASVHAVLGALGNIDECIYIYIYIQCLFWGPEKRPLNPKTMGHHAL